MEVKNVLEHEHISYISNCPEVQEALVPLARAMKLNNIIPQLRKINLEKEKVTMLLQTWKTRQGKKATVAALTQILMAEDLTNVAEGLEDLEINPESKSVTVADEHVESSSPIISYDDMKFVSKQESVKTNHKDLARRVNLGGIIPDLQNISSMSEIIIKILETWKTRTGKKATVNALIEHLKKIKLVSVAEDIEVQHASTHAHSREERHSPDISHSGSTRSSSFKRKKSSEDTADSVVGSEDVTYEDRTTVAGLIGNNWHRLTYQLHSHEDSSAIKAQIIDHLESLPNKSIYDKCFEMLIMWRQRCEKPTKEALIKALKAIDMKGIVRALNNQEKKE